MSDRTPAAVLPGRLTESRLRLLGRLLNAPTPRTPEIAPGRVDRARAPLSSAQQRIWFFNQLRPDSALYNITGIARLTGALDADALHRALDAVVQRHEILRTTYHAGGNGDGEPWSRVEAPSPAAMRTVDLTQLPEPEREAAIAAEHRAEASRPFDLTGDQMLRTLLLRTAPDEHVLHLSLHHIAADGWSLGVLIGELGALYPALAEGRSAELPDLPELPNLPGLPVQYADFASWQRERLDGPELRSQLREWVDRLADAAPLDLPTDRPRRQADGFAGATTPLELDADLVDRIKRYADTRHATPYMVLVAALSAVLSRWCGGRRDIVLGSAIAGRNRSEIEPLIGFFVNTAALRLDLGGAPAMNDLVDAAKTACHDAYARQDVPFERIIEELHPERDPAARVPLVRHMLVLHNSPRPRLRLPGLDITTLPVRTDTSKFELQLELAPTPDGGLDGWIEYASDLFDESTVRRIGQGLLLLLDDALARPDVPVTRLRLLTDEDRQRVVEQWSGAPVPAAGGGTLHALIERAADARPTTVAIIHGDSVLTYRDLEERANRLANRLRALGARRHDAIGICLPRCADAIVAMLAVLKSGAAYLPLDPSHPATRNARLALDAAAPLVITGSAATARELTAECGPTTRILDIADESVTSAPPDRPTAGVRPDDTAYIIFTSGSTGAPKGAINEHAAVANRILWMQQEYRLEPGEPVLHKTPLGFDVSGWEWLWPLAVGARVVVADADGHRDPGYIAGLITRHAVTTCHFVPSMLRAFVTEPAAAACAGVLRRIICSGEELPPGLAQEACEALSGTRVHNLYGPTEAAIDVTAWTVPDSTTTATATAAATGHLDRLPIGHPIAGARLYVLDEDMQPVPPGALGELFIGGVATGRGYLNRPALTAERFVPDPYAPGRRLYRTGDRARWLPDGAIDFLGRQDDQIKIRGQRIEPGEVAAALAGHPDVDRAVVVPFDDEARGVQLAGYVTLRPRPAADPEAVSTADLVDGWRTVFDETYRAATPEDPAFDIAGWVDSGTGDPIPDHEMRAWVEETVERITELGPRRVLEIGCGTGLLLTRIAPSCLKYHGTDISAPVLDRVRAAVATWDTAGVVSLEQRPAADFSGWTPGSFDTVVINSVAQYLPGVGQLVDVLRGALRVLSPGGNLFVGDVRSLPMLEALHCSILLDRLPPKTPLASLRRLVAQRVAGEEELAVHPALFEAVAGSGTTTVLAKASSYRNELTKFRYDVVITVPAPDAASGDRGAWQEWSGTLAIPTVTATATAEDGSRGWRATPDARVATDLAAVRLMRENPDGTGPRTVAELRQALAHEPEASTEPAALAESATAAGYRLLPHLGAEPGILDLELRPPGAVPLARAARPRPPGAGWTAYANDPSHAVRLRRAAAALRAHAAATLPEHMVPASLVVLTEWPVGANGKLDRSALPVPDKRRTATTGYVAPRTPTERAVATVWREALGLDRIGVHDDFFGLGGHSLLAIQVVGRLRETTGRDLPLAVLLSSPTVEAVSTLLDAAPAETQASAPIARAARRRRS